MLNFESDIVSSMYPLAQVPNIDFSSQGFNIRVRAYVNQSFKGDHLGALWGIPTQSRLQAGQPWVAA